MLLLACVIVILFFKEEKKSFFSFPSSGGRSLGTGDYGHLTIEDVPMLFRIHRLLHQLSNQGFEAAHKLQRQLYAKATSHDATDQTASCKYCNLHSYISICFVCFFAIFTIVKRHHFLYF